MAYVPRRLRPRPPSRYLIWVRANRPLSEWEADVIRKQVIAAQRSGVVITDPSFEIKVARR